MESRISQLTGAVQRVTKVALGEGTMNWKFLGKPTSGGHKYFRDQDSGRLALADNSGRLPEYTDDGILWVDTSRPVEVSLGKNGRLYVEVPLIVERTGSKSKTFGGIEDAEFLKGQRMRITFGPTITKLRSL